MRVCQIVIVIVLCLVMSTMAKKYECKRYTDSFCDTVILTESIKNPTLGSCELVTGRHIKFSLKNYKIYLGADCEDESSVVNYGECFRSFRCEAIFTPAEIIAMLIGLAIVCVCLPCVLVLIVCFPITIIVCCPCWVCIALIITALYFLSQA